MRNNWNAFGRGDKKMADTNSESLSFDDLYKKADYLMSKIETSKNITDHCELLIKIRHHNVV